MSEPQPRSKTVELWIRSFAPVSTGPSQERALERVERLESADSIAAIEIGVWGKEIERTDRSRRIPQLRTIESRLDAFERWASRTGRSLAPFFRTRDVDSAITGDRYEVQRLPTVALAEFVDGNLVHVAPCREDDRTIDVFDRLDELESDASNSVVRFDESETTTSRRDGETVGEDENAISDRTRTTAGSTRRTRFVDASPTGTNR